jgi:hypothetical protein
MDKAKSWRINDVIANLDIVLGGTEVAICELLQAKEVGSFSGRF